MSEDAHPTPALTDSDLSFYPADLPAGSPAAPLVLVLPGGSYEHHADHEGSNVAQWLAQIGLNALVVKYPVSPNRYPSGLRRVQDVLVAARNGSLNFSKTAISPANTSPADASSTGLAASDLDVNSGVDRSRIAVLGFSAGGHVAALLSTGVNPATVTPAGLVDAATLAAHEARVDLSVLCYPVISMTHEPHSQSLAALLGDADTLDNRRALSAEYLVDASTPPTFLWHTADDGGVPVSHALRYASALAAHNVPFDLHVFERGDHGKGLATGLGPLEEWSRLCQLWFAEHGWVGATS
jgi:acetyl esterase/lipase